jgi:hypothetical protein
MTTASPGERRWGLLTPVSCVTGFSEVAKHIAVLLLQRGDNRHNALSKTTSGLVLNYFSRLLLEKSKRKVRILFEAQRLYPLNDYSHYKTKADRLLICRRQSALNVSCSPPTSSTALTSGCSESNGDEANAHLLLLYYHILTTNVKIKRVVVFPSRRCGHSPAKRTKAACRRAGSATGVAGMSHNCAYFSIFRPIWYNQA